MLSGNWRSNIAVGCGVIAVLLLALWFSTVVAMGPAPGSVSPHQKRGDGQPEQGAAKPRVTEQQKQKQATEQEKYCPAGERYNECVIQLRSAVATEQQASYALYGFAALIVTLLLSLVATVAATSSAKSARSVLTDLERPHVFVEVSSAGLQPNSHTSSFNLAAGRFEYQCVNYGRTPAALVELLEEVRVLDAGQFPNPVNPETVGGRQLPTGCVASEKTPYPEGDTAMKTYDWKLLETDSIKKYAIFFIGYVRYADMILGTRYISGFCYVYDVIGGRFVRRGNNTQYNYTRQDKPRETPNRVVAAWRALRG